MTWLNMWSTSIYHKNLGIYFSIRSFKNSESVSLCCLVKRNQGTLGCVSRATNLSGMLRVDILRYPHAKPGRGWAHWSANTTLGAATALSTLRGFVSVLGLKIPRLSPQTSATVCTLLTLCLTHQHRLFFSPSVCVKLYAFQLFICIFVFWVI